MLELKSKSVYRKNLVSMVLLSGILWGSENTNFWAFSGFLDPPQTPTECPHWPQIFSVDTFWLQFKHILRWNHLKIIKDWKMTIFGHCCNLLSEIFMKSLHKIERSVAISVLVIFEIWKHLKIYYSIVFAIQGWPRW